MFKKKEKRKNIYMSAPKKRQRSPKMDYYKFRATIRKRIADHLALRAEAIEAGNKPPPFAVFQERLLQEGVTKRMIKAFVEELTKGATVENDEVVVKDK